MSSESVKFYQIQTVIIIYYYEIDLVINQSILFFFLLLVIFLSLFSMNRNYNIFLHDWTDVVHSSLSVLYNIVYLQQYRKFIDSTIKTVERCSTKNC